MLRTTLKTLLIFKGKKVCKIPSFNGLTHIAACFQQKKPDSKQFDPPVPPVSPENQSSLSPNVKPKQKTAREAIQDVQIMMGKEQMIGQLKNRIQALKKKHAIVRTKLTKEIRLPYLLCGVDRKCYHEEYAYMPHRVMMYYRIPQNTVDEYLIKIYKASLYSMIDQNESFMNEYWEEGFKEEALKSIRQAKQKFTLKITEQKNFLDRFQDSCVIVDAVMVRGLSMNRQENQHPSAYHKYEEAGQLGLTTFTPLRLTQNSELFINPETNKKVYDGYQKVVLRVLARIKTTARINVSELPVEDQVNTYEHLVLFQNQMVPAKHLQSRSKLQNLMEWLGKYRFGMWRIVDMDHFMEGNSLFRKYEKKVVLDPIFKETVMDRNYYTDVRKF